MRLESFAATKAHKLYSHICKFELFVHNFIYALLASIYSTVVFLIQANILFVPRVTYTIIIFVFALNKLSKPWKFMRKMHTDKSTLWCHYFVCFGIVSHRPIQDNHIHHWLYWMPIYFSPLFCLIFCITFFISIDSQSFFFLGWFSHRWARKEQLKHFREQFRNHINDQFIIVICDEEEEQDKNSNVIKCKLFFFLI